MNKADVIVIGGGPAGMMAAGQAAMRGKAVLLIEQNDRLGKKLGITGKGRCNVTNAAEDVEDLLANVPTNKSFLYSAFYSFTNADTMAFFESLGVPLKTERGDRVFPVSDRALDVVGALRKWLKEKGVRVLCGKVEELISENQEIRGVRLKDGTVFDASSVIIATGGVSYPATGSTGDGYRFAESVGHTVVAPKPSLVPLVTREKWVKDLMGLSLKNIEVTFSRKGKTVFKDFGEMLFTHFGVSGPVILSASAHLKDGDISEYSLAIDLKPALDFEKLDARVLRDFDAVKNRYFSHALDKLLPKRLIPVIISLLNIDPTKPVNLITKEERLGLVKLLKALPLHMEAFRPVDEAIITSGGVSVKEINPSTMASKKVKGLYFAGEVIDVDAYTGGYNLQIAFSTGYLAGNNCE